MNYILSTKIKPMRLKNYFMVVFLLFIRCETDTKLIKSQPWKEYSSYEEAGFDEKKLDNLTAFIKENSNTSGLVVISDGKKIYQYGDIRDISYIASCRKSILAMLMGKYVENGTIDLSKTLDELEIDDIEGLMEIEKSATVDHLATARSGVFHIASNSGYDTRNILKRGSVKPGTYYLYNNWDFNAIGFIFEKLTGNSIYKELEEQIAKPVGFEDWDFKLQKKSGDLTKSKYPAYHMYLSTRDMAKVGQLMLDNGEWNGKQLFSKKWLKKIVTQITPKDTVTKRRSNSKSLSPKFGYSYMWWTFDEFKGDNRYKNSFSAHGYGGQFITVIPGMRLVFAHKTNFREKTNGKFTPKDVYYQIIDFIVNAKI